MNKEPQFEPNRARTKRLKEEEEEGKEEYVWKERRRRWIGGGDEDGRRTSIRLADPSNAAMSGVETVAVGSMSNPLTGTVLS